MHNEAHIKEMKKFQNTIYNKNKKRKKNKIK